MDSPLTHFDLAIHLVAGAAAEEHGIPIEKGLEDYLHVLSLGGAIDGDEFVALEQIVGRLDPEVVWRPAHKHPEGGSYTEGDVERLHGEHNLVHWLTTELTASEDFRDADVDGIIGFIRGRLQIESA